jgi:hypothetical protein
MTGLISKKLDHSSVRFRFNKYFGEYTATKAMISENNILRLTRSRGGNYEFCNINAQIGETTQEVIQRFCCE